MEKMGLIKAGQIQTGRYILTRRAIIAALTLTQATLADRGRARNVSRPFNQEILSKPKKFAAFRLILINISRPNRLIKLIPIISNLPIPHTLHTTRKKDVTETAVSGREIIAITKTEIILPTVTPLTPPAPTARIPTVLIPLIPPAPTK